MRVASQDILIIGGGPAGLATAIAARQNGLGVVVLERAAPPIDKACGEGLMPDGLAVLRGLGVELGAESYRPFYGIRYVDGETVAEGRFAADPGIYGAGVRRVRLHEALAERAAALGIEVRWRTRVLDLRPDSQSLVAETTAGALRVRFVVGADGLHSRVRRWAGLAGRPARPWLAQQGRFGVRRHFTLAPWSDLVEVHWGEDCEAYVTPVSAEEVGVALLWSGRKAGFDQLLESFPVLASRLSGAPEISRDRGAGPLRQRVRAVARGRVALVGDASGYVDAITGEGLSLAFHQALALAEALRRGDLGHYVREHRRLGRFANVLTELLLIAERRPWLRRRVVRALARDGALFSRLLAVHAGVAPVRRGLGSAPRLLWRMAGA